MITLVVAALVLVVVISAAGGDRADIAGRAFRSYYWVPAVLLAIGWLARDPLTRVLGYGVILVLLGLFLASLYLTIAGVRQLVTGETEREETAVHAGRVLVAALPLLVLGGRLVLGGSF